MVHLLRMYPFQREGIDFLIRYKNDAAAELWHAYSTELTSTVQFEAFVRQRPALTPLLYSAKDAIAWRNAINKKPITEVKSGDVAYVDLRCYGFAWYDNLKLPDSDTKTYVLAYHYNSPKKKRPTINAHVSALNQVFSVNHAFVYMYGSVLSYDPETMVIVDRNLIRQYPAILKD